MNLVCFAVIIAACGAAKLDRTYLPPPSATFAGGSPGSLQVPFHRSNTGYFQNPFARVSGSDQGSQLPTGSYVNDHQGVVVDAAAPGTRASNQESGLGGPRVTYGSTDSKVGDAAFRGTKYQAQLTEKNPAFQSQFGVRIPGTGFLDTNSNPDLSAFHQVPSSRPKVDQLFRDRVSNTIKYQSNIGPNRFNYAFETENGIKMEENGVSINGVKSQGGYSYTGDDGQVYSVVYTADENGFKPKGSHLPTPPPIPVEILQSLEQNARDEAAGVIDDGSYDAQKYNEEDDYTKSDANGKYNDRQSNKFGGRPGFNVDTSGTFINQNKQAFVKPNNNQRFSFDSFNDFPSSKPGSQFGSGINKFDSILNKSNGFVSSGSQGNHLNNNGFGLQNQQFPPFGNFQSSKLQGASSYPGSTNFQGIKHSNYNTFPSQSFSQNLSPSQQKLQIQGSFDRPSSFGRPNFYDTSIPALVSTQHSSLPAYIQNQAPTNGFSGYNNGQFTFGQSFNRDSSQEMLQNLDPQGVGTNYQFGQASIGAQSSSKPDSNHKPSPQTSYGDYSASDISSLRPSLPNQPSKTITNIPQIQSSDLPATQFLHNSIFNQQFQLLNNKPNSIERFGNTDENKNRNTSGPDFSIFSQPFVPTKLPEVTLTTPLETEEPNSSVSFTSSDLTTPQQTTVFSGSPSVTTQSKFPLNITSSSDFNEKLSTTLPSLTSNTGADTGILSLSPSDLRPLLPIIENSNTSQKLDNNESEKVNSPLTGTIDLSFLSTTEVPSKSSQFIGQPQGPDDSYIYSRPTKTFETPSTIKPGVPSIQPNKITQPIIYSSLFTNAPEVSRGSRPSSLPSIAQTSGITNENNLNDYTYQTNGITQASISPFPTVIPTSSSKQQSSQPDLKPNQQSVLLNTPSLESFLQTGPTPTTTHSFTTKLDIERTNALDQQQNQFGQRNQENIENSQDTSTTIQMKEYTGEVYEYNKPLEDLSVSSQKENTDEPVTKYDQQSSSTPSQNKDVNKPTQEGQSDIGPVEQKISSSSQNGQTKLPFEEATANLQSNKYSKPSIEYQTTSSIFGKQPSSSFGKPTTASRFEAQSTLPTNIARQPTSPSQFNTRTSSSTVQKITSSQLGPYPSSPLSVESTPPGFDAQSITSPEQQTTSSNLGVQPSSSPGQGNTQLFGQQSISLRQPIASSLFSTQPTSSLKQQTTPSRFSDDTTSSLFNLPLTQIFTEEPTKQPFGTKTNSFIEEKTKPSTVPQQTNTNFNYDLTTPLPITSETLSVQGENTGAGEIYEYSKPTTSFLTTSQAGNDMRILNQSQFSDQDGLEGFTTSAFSQQPLSTFETRYNTNKNQLGLNIGQTMSTPQETPSTINSQTEYEFNLPGITDSLQKEITVIPDQESTINEQSSTLPGENNFTSLQDAPTQYGQEPQSSQFPLQTTKQTYQTEGSKPTSQSEPKELSSSQFSHQTQQLNSQSTPDQQSISTVSLTVDDVDTQPTQQSQLSTQSSQQRFPTTQDLSTTPFGQQTTVFQVDEQTSTSGEVYEYNKPAQTLATTPQKANNEQTEDQGTQSYTRPITAQFTLFGNIQTTTQGTSIKQSQNADLVSQQKETDNNSQSKTNEGSLGNGKPLAPRTQFSFKSACCNALKNQNDRGTITRLPTNQSPTDPTLGNVGDFKKDKNQNADKNSQKELQSRKQGLGATSSLDNGNQKGTTLSFAGKGEDFGGPRKAPSFDETGYHY